MKHPSIPAHGRNEKKTLLAATAIFTTIVFVIFGFASESKLTIVRTVLHGLSDEIYYNVLMKNDWYVLNDGSYNLVRGLGKSHTLSSRVLW